LNVLNAFKTTMQWPELSNAFESFKMGKRLLKRGWAQEKVAKVVGIPQQTISRLENGSNTQMSITAIPEAVREGKYS
jgi:DNA-binding XRE family transcriptional regulator